MHGAAQQARGELVIARRKPGWEHDGDGLLVDPGRPGQGGPRAPVRGHDPPVGCPGAALESLPEGSTFMLYNGKTFQKGPLVRKRYRCFCVDNKRTYLVNPLATVEPANANR